MSGLWQLWVGAGAKATLAFDSKDKHSGNVSARVTVTTPVAKASFVDLHLDGIGVAKGMRYNVSFWARASAEHSVALNSRHVGGSWESYGLDAAVVVGVDWAPYSVLFTSTGTDPDARVSFYLGDSKSTVWVDDFRVAPAGLPILERDYQCGRVILNADGINHTVGVGEGFRRLKGPQAPRWQYIVDDASAAFHADSHWKIVTLESGYSMARPTMEEPTGPYYHHWARGCHISTGEEGKGTADVVAKWDLGVVDVGM